MPHYAMPQGLSGDGVLSCREGGDRPSRPGAVVQVSSSQREARVKQSTPGSPRLISCHC